ncbi:MAG TPA: polysaccharide deacetylase family protein [Myxococcota bacterium]
MSASITIDLDGVRHYHAIHGLAQPQGNDPVVERGLARFLELCDRACVSSTIFVVGADLNDDAIASLIKRAARAGHEIASHSFAHAYDLSRHERGDIDHDLEASIAAIARVVGAKPVGFRAPGYNISEPLLDGMERAGFAYDSSVMQSPPYFVARAAHVALQRLKRAPSSSIVGSARAFWAPRDPYRPARGAAWREAKSRVEGRDVVELPIATLPGGLPLFGTSLAMLPSSAAAAYTALAAHRSRQSCVLELHAIDLCDDSDGFDATLISQRKDLDVPAARKLERFAAVFRVLAQAHDVRTLREVAESVA